MNEETEVKQEEAKEETKVLVHESGLRYLSIPLTSEKGDTMEIKLFESIKPERLEFENHTEYKIRRRFNNNQTKKHLKGYIFWKSKNNHDLMKGITNTSWGSLTKQKAAQMISAMINKKQNEKSKEV